MKPIDVILAEIKERADSATEGPWRVDSGMNYTIKNGVRFQHILAAGGDNPDCGKAICDTSSFPEIIYPDGSVSPKRDGNIKDAKFIAHARTDVPRLIAALEVALSRLEVIGSRCGIPDARHACYLINKDCQKAEEQIAKILRGGGDE